MVSQKENDKFLATEFKDTEYCDKVFKLAAMKKFNPLQENSGSTMISGIKSMNKSNTLPKRVKFYKRAK